MNWRALTQWFVIVVTALILGYDLFVYLHGGTISTISRVILSWSQRNPFWPFACGFFMGHLFWPQPAEKI